MQRQVCWGAIGGAGALGRVRLLGFVLLVAGVILAGCGVITVSTPTATPGARASTPPAAPSPRAKGTQAPNKAEARYVDPRELAANVPAFVGQNVWLQGEAGNVGQQEEYTTLAGTLPSFTWMRLLAGVRGQTAAESVVVEFYPKDSRIAERQCYRIYGTVVGTQDAPYGIPNLPKVMPRVRSYAWESAPRGPLGCSPS